MTCSESARAVSEGVARDWSHAWATSGSTRLACKPAHRAPVLLLLLPWWGGECAAVPRRVTRRGARW
jgi:hypothetical protein